jgi:periplasmic protein TonB
MITYLLMLVAATPGTANTPPAKQAVEGLKSCPDGTEVPFSKPCPALELQREQPPIEKPPPPPAFPRAVSPKNNIGQWVTINDYPARALQMEEEGTTGFRLEVGKDGRVIDCTIIASSGSAALDAAACKNVTRRAHFSPALDDDGQPTIGYYSNRVRWRIPSEPSYAQQIGFDTSGPQAVLGAYIEIAESDYPLIALEKGMRGQAVVVLTVSASGSVTDCKVNTGSGSEVLDSKSCELASKWTFLPARNNAGEPVVGITIHQFGWSLPDAWKEYQRTGNYPPKSM